jgi:hypothetical protein
MLRPIAKDEIAEPIGEPVDVFQVEIQSIGIAARDHPSLRRFTGQM